MKKILLLFLVLPCVCVADDWQYQVEPYLMATSIDGDASIGRVTGVDLGINMNTILETLDMAGMIHFEAINERNWGVIIDYGFMDLSDDISGSRGGTVDASVHQGVLEVLVFKRRDLDRGYIDWFAGARRWDNDIEVEVDPAILPGTLEVEIDEDWVDLVAGLRWRRPMNERWQFTFSADIGGLGQDADFTSSVSVGALYKINQRLELDLRYRGTWVDFESGTRGQRGYFEYDTVTHGPVVGLSINF
jgi:hypothetical protein